MTLFDFETIAVNASDGYRELTLLVGHRFNISLKVGLKDVVELPAVKVAEGPSQGRSLSEEMAFFRTSVWHLSQANPGLRTFLAQNPLWAIWKFPITLHDNPVEVINKFESFVKFGCPNDSLPNSEEVCGTWDHCVASWNGQFDAIVAGVRASRVDASPTRKPVWDEVSLELRLGDFVVKRYTQDAPNQKRILTAFQEESWPGAILDPLPRNTPDPAGKRREALRGLNKNNGKIRFESAGDGHIRWRLVDDSGGPT